MPAPSYRFILCAALLAPLTLLAVVSHELWVIVLLVYTLLLVVATMDYFASKTALDSISIACNSPLRISKDSAGTIEVIIKSEGPGPQHIDFGLPLPQAFENEDEIKHAILTPQKNSWSLAWTCRATKRGIYPIHTLYSACLSNFGLWTLRKALPLQLEIRVYPNLRRDQNQLANLFLNRGLTGLHHQRMVGKGREYDRLRDYTAGDSMLDLHWKASAKRNTLVTKTYQVERTQEIYVLIDHARLSSRLLDNQSDTVLERFVTAASVLGLAADRTGDLFGLVTFSHHVNQFVRASSGRNHLQAIQDAIFGLNSAPVPPDFDELLTFLRTRLRRRALLIILTDLSDPAVADAFCQRIPLITRQHHVLVNMLQEPNVAPLFDPDNPVNTNQDVYQHLAGHLRWKDLRERQLTLRRMGVDLKLIQQERLSVDIVNQYIAVKQKQIL